MRNFCEVHFPSSVASCLKANEEAHRRLVADVQAGRIEIPSLFDEKALDKPWYACGRRHTRSADKTESGLAEFDYVGLLKCLGK